MPLAFDMTLLRPALGADGTAARTLRDDPQTADILTLVKGGDGAPARNAIARKAKAPTAAAMRAFALSRTLPPAGS